MSSVNNIIQKNHYAPKAVNDSLSSYVFNSFIENLDEDEMYFIASDFDQLKKYKYRLDDAILEEKCDFITHFFTIYKNSLLRTKAILTNITSDSLNFEKKDSLYYSTSSDFDFAENEKQLAKYWNRKIKKETIYRFLDMTDTGVSFNDKMPYFANQVIANELCIINDKIQKDSELLATLEDLFLNTFCLYFDPHTNYFNPSDKSYFDESLHDDYKSIGVYFSKTDEGLILVDEIQLGSTAWKDGIIDVGDQVLKVSSNGTNLNMSCISTETLYKFIYDPSNTNLEFRIKKKNSNTINTVSLEKENIRIQDNAVDSFILEGKRKIGYIKLPGFYTSDDFGMGCANDIAKELLRLNKVPIEGLILDLRDNGGGSLQEATDLVGLFIDRGPVAILNTNENDKKIVKDYNRGAVFNKPLIVLVNESSASASEYVTASLQDHKRALVVGSNTFGKASGQNIFIANNNNPKSGYVKVTIERLYRITGSSWQKDGVTPDFKIPNPLERFGFKERYYDNVLKNDSITRNIYFKIPPKKEISGILEKSNNRLDSSEDIKLVKEINEDLIHYFDNRTPLALNIKGIESRKKDFDIIWKKLDKLKHDQTIYAVNNTDTTNEILAKNKDVEAINKKKKDNVLKDYEILESYQIINDLITNENK
ncbi:tail-specific protease [Neptunitalea chrysea]|uniref:Tail-specific protease n=1 Tax=Neptunitalea chrysea TaxID=1647581 RepID=A0A9W6EUB1_9FLAO|nr:tail-specific protease [Neptunitalea chrysea]